jgi:NADH-quinone oxidoreductase subunit G
MCDEGRYGYHHVHSDRRLTTPRRRDGADLSVLEWSQVIREIDERLRAVGRVGAVLSPHLTVEEAYLLAKYARQIDPRALIVSGPVPVEGADERFKNGFTIRAEKCPNRRGVEEIVAHFMGRRATFDDLLAGVEAGELRGIWVSGGYRGPWIDASMAERLVSAECLVVQDMFDSPLVERATYQLPGAAFAEREGSYVNHADRLQGVEWAIRPPAGVRVEAGVYGQLLALPGMVNVRRVLDEVAREIPFFAAAAGEVDELGIDLKAVACATPAATS